MVRVIVSTLQLTTVRKIVPFFIVQSNTVQKHCVKKDCALLHRATQHCAIEHCANEHCAKDAVQMAHVIVCTVQKILPFFIVNSSTVRYLSK